MKDKTKFLKRFRAIAEEVFDLKCGECGPLLANKARKSLGYSATTRDLDILRALKKVWNSGSGEGT